jgi:hypothetical protein
VDLNHRSRFAGLCAASKKSWIQPGPFEETLSALLFLQFILSPSCSREVRLALSIDKLPRTGADRPMFAGRAIMLVEAMLRIIRDADVKATP